MVKQKEQFIFTEGDDISAIYFFQKGTAGYILPRHHNIMYV